MKNKLNEDWSWWKRAQVEYFVIVSLKEQLLDILFIKQPIIFNCDKK